MNMIGHNHKFIYGDSRDSIAANNIILYDLTDFRQGNHRGVVGAAPYDVAENLLSVLGADGDEVCSALIIIIIRNTIRPSLR